MGLKHAFGRQMMEVTHFTVLRVQRIKPPCVLNTEQQDDHVWIKVRKANDEAHETIMTHITGIV